MKNNQDNKKFKEIGHRMFNILIIPAISIIVSIIICSISGTSLLVNKGSWTNLIYGISTLTLIAFAVSINLHTGRFDFSIGSMLTLCSTTITILARNGMNNVFLLVLISLGIGLACGLVSGILYVILKLPSMIISLGATLLFEALSYIITNGKSLSIQTGNSVAAENLNNFVGNTGNYTFIILITIVTVLLLVVLFNYTKFGNDYHALQTGQKIAVSTGINEVKNTIICYALSGLLMGLVASFYAAKIQSTRPDSMLNFASVGTMFNAFCPLFFADYIRRSCKKESAILIGVISYQILQLAFGNIQAVNTNFTSTVYGIINSLILVIFLIYLNNEDKVKKLFTGKKKKNAALQSN